MDGLKLENILGMDEDRLLFFVALLTKTMVSVTFFRFMAIIIYPIRSDACKSIQVIYP